MLTEVDLAKSSVRTLNARLHKQTDKNRETGWRILNPGGRHNIAVGINAALTVRIEGHTGYYCAGMNQHATITVHGNVGPGVAENMMSGVVHVTGNASQYAGATAHGGLLVIEGNTSSRCGISMKGIDIVVKGSVGHLSAFMAQAGRLVICGDAGDALGDSLYEARIYLKGKTAGLGMDCIQKPMREQHLVELNNLLQKAGITGMDASGFRRYGSARKLYHFDVDNVDSY